MSSIRGSRWVLPNIKELVVYSNPNSGSARVGSVCAREQVTYLGEKQNGFALIEFNIGGAVKKGYTNASSLCDRITDIAVLSPGTAFIKNQRIFNWLPYGGAECFQGFNDVTTNLKGHFGYDLNVPGGIIKPMFEGVVEMILPNVGAANGRTVSLRHCIEGEEFFTTYSHMASVEKLTKGQTVYPTTKLGIMGGSGKTENDFGKHLHLCLYITKPQSDPFGYCDASHKKSFAETVQSGGSKDGFYYGSDSKLYPHCGGVRFYDPYRVYTSGVRLLIETRHKL